jgi:hypothetical protein
MEMRPLLRETQAFCYGIPLFSGLFAPAERGIFPMSHRNRLEEIFLNKTLTCYIDWLDAALKRHLKKQANSTLWAAAKSVFAV